MEKAEIELFSSTILVKVNSITESSGTAISNTKLLASHLKYAMQTSYS